MKIACNHNAILYAWQDTEGRQYFVATQGPLASTVSDFWRMVCELRIHTIIMLTNLTERATVSYCNVQMSLYFCASFHYSVFLN